MHAPTTLQTTSSTARNVPNVVVLQARRERRERDFGIGYGSSSGYASAKRYTNDWGLTRFRCA